MILDFDYVYDKYDLNVSGIIHIGGHYGNEIQKYKSHNVNDIVLFEPLTSNFSVLNDIVKNTKGNIVAHQVALGNDNRRVTMNISSNEAQSSSILTPKVHLTAHPEVTFSGTEEVEMKKLDDYNYQDYNMIVVDVQGYELEVLKGASNTLNNIDYIYCEVNCDEVYEDNARVEEIDEFLSSYGFKRVETQWYYTGVWGDALYIKNKLHNFPTVYYISLEESVDRQKNITEQFEQYGITPIPIISKRFAESDDIVTGKYLHELNSGTIGCCVSHLKAIKQWYENTDEDYGFFCEDDLSLETVKYWDFTWEEFFQKTPENFQCLQLLTVRGDFETFELREREWNDWAVTAYVITRDYARILIDTYVVNDTYNLDIPNSNVMPLIENILFFGKTYTVPLFIENIEFNSTFVGTDDDVKDGQKRNHYYSHKQVLNYWKYNINENMNKSRISKIIDYFMYFNEKELLELRINLLKDYVDKFVIVDANRSYTGKEKPFSCKNTLKQLGLWDENKIQVIELELHSDDEEVDFVDIDKFFNNNDHELMLVGSRERKQRDALLSIIDQFDDETVFIVSDCDEIINPEHLTYVPNIIRSNPNIIFKIPLIYFDGRADLRLFYEESNNPVQWDCSMFLATKNQLKTHTPNEIRSNFNICYPISYIGQYENENYVRYGDMGWHFSWMGDTERKRLKSVSYSHYDHEFDQIIYKKCSGKLMEEFIENHIVKEGNIGVSGLIGTITKKYPIENLPQIIFDLPRVKQFLLPTTQMKTKIEKLLTNYALDPENPENNFPLGLWYEKEGHTAPALSYFLRCAEREEDTDMQYLSLIKCYYCYDRQGTRDGTAKSLLLQAISILPKRPEAHFLLCKFYEKRNDWSECYARASLALEICDFDCEPLLVYVEYPGKYGLLFEKAISGWWWGKNEESKSLFISILNDYDDVEPLYIESIKKNLNLFGDKTLEEISQLTTSDSEFKYSDNFDWSDLTYEDIITIEREIVHEKCYRFWKDVKEGDVVLDIGASVGAYVVSILNQKPKKVYCVEPSKKLLKTLAKNCSEQIFDCIENPLVYINKGIIDHKDDNINIFGGEREFSGITFNKLIDDYSIDKINFLKIDCEGGEYSIFRDENIEFLMNNVDFIAMEIHLNYDGCREKFKNFRDNYLIQFQNYKVMSCTRQNISWGESLDIKDKIFDNTFIDDYTCEFMIYISNTGNGN